MEAAVCRSWECEGYSCIP